MGRIGQAINTAREAAEHAVPNPEAIKAAALNTCRGAIETCKGSGSIRTELVKIKDSCINLPLGMAANSLKACTQLLTLQPIKATCTVARGLTDACKEAAKIAVSPLPTGIAAIKQTARAGVTVAKLPVTAPLAVYRVAERGLTRATDILFGSENLPAPANDNANAGPPPAASSAMPMAA
ncbi:MAG: hypothetical protein V1880_01915 [Patescibacteria group bacterium]